MSWDVSSQQIRGSDRLNDKLRLRSEAMKSDGFGWKIQATAHDFAFKTADRETCGFFNTKVREIFRSSK